MASARPYDDVLAVLATRRICWALHQATSGSTAGRAHDSGLDRHTEDLKQLVVYAPDTQVTEHSIKLGSGNLTAVTACGRALFWDSQTFAR